VVVPQRPLSFFKNCIAQVINCAIMQKKKKKKKQKSNENTTWKQRLDSSGDDGSGYK
jgi:hypothetical protein